MASATSFDAGDGGAEASDQEAPMEPAEMEGGRGDGAGDRGDSAACACASRVRIRLLCRGGRCMEGWPLLLSEAQGVAQRSSPLLAHGHKSVALR